MDRISVKTLIPYYGGKNYMKKDIYDIILNCYHKTKFRYFVDVFGGSGKVVFHLPPEIKAHRIYNDIDSNLTTLFKVLQDEEKRKKLFEKIKWAFDSEEIFREYINERKQNNKKYKGDDVEIAFKTIYVLRFSFSGTNDSRSFFDEKNRNKTLWNTEDVFNKWFKQIFNNLTVLNSSYEKIIKLANGKKAFLYLDPPYLEKGRYLYGNWKVEDFKKLKSLLDDCDCYWLLNESNIEEISKIFGEPYMVKEYTQMANNRNRKTTTRIEGFWLKC